MPPILLWNALIRRLSLIAWVAAAAGLWSETSGAMEPALLQPGDTVRVAYPGSILSLETGGTVQLGEGTELQVSEVNGTQVKGSFQANANLETGWIASARLRKPDDPRGVEALAQLEGVRLHKDRFGSILSIDASGSASAGAVLPLMEGLFSLESLDLSRSRVTNEELRQIPRRANLRRLYLDQTSINDEGLIYLRRLTNLEVLVLSHSHIRGEGLIYLKHLKKLRVLNLSDCRIGDEDLSPLGNQVNLEILALANTHIRGSGLRHLQSMPYLNVVNLNGCPLETGALLHLVSLKNLRILHVRGTQIPNADREAVQAVNRQLFISE